METRHGMIGRILSNKDKDCPTHLANRYLTLLSIGQFLLVSILCFVYSAGQFCISVYFAKRIYIYMYIKIFFTTFF